MKTSLIKTISYDSRHGYSGKSNPISVKFAKKIPSQHFLCKCLIANVSHVQSQKQKHQNNT